MCIQVVFQSYICKGRRLAGIDLYLNTIYTYKACELHMDGASPLPSDHANKVFYCTSVT